MEKKSIHLNVPISASKLRQLMPPTIYREVGVIAGAWVAHKNADKTLLSPADTFFPRSPHSLLNLNQDATQLEGRLLQTKPRLCTLRKSEEYSTQHKRHCHMYSTSCGCSRTEDPESGWKCCSMLPSRPFIVHLIANERRMQRLQLVCIPNVA